MVETTPFSDKTFVKTAIASGALVPPPGGYPSPAMRLVRLAGWIMALAGVVALVVAIYLARP